MLDKLKESVKEIERLGDKLEVSMKLEKDFPELTYPIKIGVSTKYPHYVVYIEGATKLGRNDHIEIVFKGSNKKEVIKKFSDCHRLYQNVAIKIIQRGETK